MVSREVKYMIKFSRRNGRFGAFSNFHTCNMTFDGITYTSSEAAWQAQKTTDVSQRMRFATYTPSVAKKMGRQVQLREDWEDVKYKLMVEVCYAKFSQNENLKRLLLSTGEEELVENTTGWHDNIWGNCECERCINKEGRNLLGKALMEVRKLLRKE